jgi:hypothetical protein
MKSTGWTAGCIALVLACGAGVVAQDSQATTDDRTRKTSQSSSMTITGCLQGAGANVPAVGTSTAGTVTGSATEPSDSRSSAGRFVLMNARMGSRETGRTSTTTGAATTTAPAKGTTAPAKGTTAPAKGTTAASYVLEGDSSELRKHVGHQIEVTGHLDTAASAAPPAAATSVATSGTAGAVAEDTKNRAASAAAMPHVRVDSVRMISANCSK